MLKITSNKEHETVNPIMSVCRLISILLLNTDYMFSEEMLQYFKKYYKGESITEINNSFCTREEKKRPRFSVLGEEMIEKDII